jgi:hypothetical protein
MYGKVISKSSAKELGAFIPESALENKVLILCTNPNA